MVLLIILIRNWSCSFIGSSSVSVVGVLFLGEWPRRSGMWWRNFVFGRGIWVWELGTARSSSSGGGVGIGIGIGREIEEITKKEHVESGGSGVNPVGAGPQKVARGTGK